MLMTLLLLLLVSSNGIRHSLIWNSTFQLRTKQFINYEISHLPQYAHVNYRPNWYANPIFVKIWITYHLNFPNSSTQTTTTTKLITHSPFPLAPCQSTREIRKRPSAPPASPRRLSVRTHPNPKNPPSDGRARAITHQPRLRAQVRALSRRSCPISFWNEVESYTRAFIYRRWEQFRAGRASRSK